MTAATRASSRSIAARSWPPSGDSSPLLEPAEDSGPSASSDSASLNAVEAAVVALAAELVEETPASRGASNTPAVASPSAEDSTDPPAAALGSAEDAAAPAAVPSAASSTISTVIASTTSVESSV